MSSCFFCREHIKDSEEICHKCSCDISRVFNLPFPVLHHNLSGKNFKPAAVGRDDFYNFYDMIFREELFISGNMTAFKKDSFPKKRDTGELNIGNYLGGVLFSIGYNIRTVDIIVGNMVLGRRLLCKDGFDKMLRQTLNELSSEYVKIVKIMYSLNSSSDPAVIYERMGEFSIAGGGNIERLFSRAVISFFEKKHAMFKAAVYNKVFMREFIWRTAASGYYFKIGEELACLTP